MERYDKPIMTLEEMEEEVYTDTATGTTIVSENATPGQTLVNPTGRT